MAKVIMILTNLFRPDVRVLREAKYLVEKGIEVEILCWDRKNELKDMTNEIIDGIKIKRFYPIAEPGTGLKQLKSYIVFIMECRRYIKNQDIDYLHCHDLDGMIAGVALGAKNTKMIFDMHEFYEAQKRSIVTKYLTRMATNYLQRKVTYIIYVNEAQKSIVKLSNIDKLIYLPNYPVADDLKDSGKIFSDRLRISYIGIVRQFDQLKNLMEACKGIKEVQISIHGAGVDVSKLKAIEDEYNNVAITGPYHFLESSMLYSNTDISYIVYPIDNYQNYIGEPVKFFEAIVTQTPMIISKGMKISEFVIENNIGFTVNGNDSDEIRNLVYSILHDKSLIKDKEENLKRIQNNYCWEKVVNNMERAYNLNHNFQKII